MKPPKQKKFHLPKSLLEMKFMKKTKEKEEQRKEDSDRQTMFQSQITDEMVTGSQKIIEEQSLVPLLGLVEGRFSFCGQNPEIERLMESEEAAKLEAVEKKKQEQSEKCVMDEDMAERLGRLSKSIGLKFMNKRQRCEIENTESTSRSAPEPNDDEQHRKRFKFLKPPSP